MRMPLWAGAAFLVAYGAAAGAFQAGPRVDAWATPALVAAVAFALGVVVGDAVTGLALRDPEKGWALASTNARGVLLLLGLLAFVGGFGPGIAAACGLAAGDLGRRGQPTGSDVAMLGVLGLFAVAIWLDPHPWDDAPAFLVPAGAVALALAAREGWDLADLRRNARALAAGSSTRAPRDDSPRAFLAAGAVLVAAVCVAFALGEYRDAWRGLALGDVGVRVVAGAVLLGAVVGLARLFLAPKKA